jgi:aldose 1-epimerase
MMGRYAGWVLSVAVVVGLCGCERPAGSADRVAKKEGMGAMGVTKEKYGQLASGEAVDLYTLRNGRGMTAKITNYGAILTELWVEDRAGQADDVVLGYDRLEDYVKDTPYFGAIVGRYGNRIAHGRFTLDGKEYTLAKNWKIHHLHGGKKGFDKVAWTAKPFERGGEVGLKLSYLSADGEEGYPGNLKATVTYTLTADNALRIDYEATTDKTTPVNLTHHSYFNLAGAGKRDNLDHEMMIAADKFTPTNEGLIPTGELRSVEGTPFDFRKPTKIGARIDADDEQIKFGGGYDHNWVLNRKKASDLELAVRVSEPTTGRVMEVWTTEPGMQFYAGNFLDGSNVGKGGRAYKHRYGFCLEAQHYPNSPNQAGFPSTILRPGEVYRQRTEYRFSTR